MIRVTILSPNNAMRVGLREMLQAHSDIQVVAEVRDLDEIDVPGTEVLVLASVSVSQISGGLSDSYGVLILTDDPEDARSLVESGKRAWGIVSASVTGDEIAAAVRAVGEGLCVGTPSLVQGLMRYSKNTIDQISELTSDALTAREQEVLQWLAEGLANKQIALRLGISEHTVKFHLSSLYVKLNVSSRTEAVKRGLHSGLITL